MARFYGTVQGQRGEAHRLGHSGLDVSAQSYSGDIHVKMYKGADDSDYVHIECSPHDSFGCRGFVMYSGPVKTLLDTNARAARLQALGIEEFIKAHEEANKNES